MVELDLNVFASRNHSCITKEHKTCYHDIYSEKKKKKILGWGKKNTTPREFMKIALKDK